MLHFLITRLIFLLVIYVKLYVDEIQIQLKMRKIAFYDLLNETILYVLDKKKVLKQFAFKTNCFKSTKDVLSVVSEMN